VLLYVDPSLVACTSYMGSPLFRSWPQGILAGLANAIFTCIDTTKNESLLQHMRSDGGTPFYGGERHRSLTKDSLPRVCELEYLPSIEVLVDSKIIRESTVMN